MQRFMLDTNTLSYICKGRSPVARERLDSLRGSEAVCLSSLTEAELLYGMRKRRVSNSLVAEVEQFLENLAVLEWGRNEAATYATLRAAQEALGKPLANLDMLIAAHALATNAILVTNDRAFLAVEQLRIENWAVDL